MSFLRRPIPLPKANRFFRWSSSTSQSSQPPAEPAPFTPILSNRSPTLQNAPNRKPSHKPFSYGRSVYSGGQRKPNTNPLSTRQADLRERARSAKEKMADLELRKSIGRRWTPGDVYSPRDLGDREQGQWLKKRRDRSYDVFEMIGKDPRSLYRNITVMSEFLSDSGQLLSRNQTGLKKKNQRRLLKAVRRARGIGLMPTTHHHPQLLPRNVGGVMTRS